MTEYTPAPQPASKDGGPAFPCSTEIPIAMPAGAVRNGFRIRDCGGLSVRQWYKGMAVQGLLANPSNGVPQYDAGWKAGEIADAMLAEDAQHAASERNTMTTETAEPPTLVWLGQYRIETGPCDFWWAGGRVTRLCQAWRPEEIDSPDFLHDWESPDYPRGYRAALARARELGLCPPTQGDEADQRRRLAKIDAETEALA